MAPPSNGGLWGAAPRMLRLPTPTTALWCLLLHYNLSQRRSEISLSPWLSVRSHLTEINCAGPFSSRSSHDHGCPCWTQRWRRLVVVDMPCNRLVTDQELGWERERGVSRRLYVVACNWLYPLSFNAIRIAKLPIFVGSEGAGEKAQARKSVRRVFQSIVVVMFSYKDKWKVRCWSYDIGKTKVECWMLLTHIWTICWHIECYGTIWTEFYLENQG